MAHLWTLRGTDGWRAHQLGADAEEIAASSGIALRRVGHAPDTWALLSAAPALRVNGVPVPLGLVVLEDRDEIRLHDLTAWFSTEMLARVEDLPETVAHGVCPRCKQSIAPGTAAVRCPACGLWHHQSDEYPCWTYAATCASCPHASDLDAGFRWTPEDL